jgi:hypothetical protein
MHIKADRCRPIGNRATHVSSTKRVMHEIGKKAAPSIEIANMGS